MSTKEEAGCEDARKSGDWKRSKKLCVEYLENLLLFSKSTEISSFLFLCFAEQSVLATIVSTMYVYYYLLLRIGGTCCAASNILYIFIN